MPILTDIHFDRVIVHSISAKAAFRGPEINFSAHSLVPQSNELEPLIDRINNAFADGSKSLKLSIKNTNPQSTPFLCHSIIRDHLNAQIFEQNSNRIAQNLADSFFTSNIPGGLLVVALGTDLESRLKFVLLIKAEIHDGFQTTNSNGTTKLEYIQRIVLSKNSKLYKFGLLLQNTSTNRDETDLNTMYDTYVFDLQIKPGAKDEAASYFFSTFLNCEIQKTDNKLTKMFYEKTKNFIKTISDDSERLDANINLKSFLRNTDIGTIDIHDYCELYIPLDYQNAFLTEMESDGSFPRSFAKDPILIHSALQRNILKFKNGVEMTIPQAEQPLYEITEQTADSTAIRIFSRYVGEK